MTKTDKRENQRIITPEFRVSFPHVFKPNSIKGGKPKYSITMLFPKTADLSKLKIAMKHAKIDKFGPDQSQWPEGMLSPVQDGDHPKYKDREGYKGHWIIKASASEDRRPEVVGRDLKPIIEASTFYPGCYARAHVYAFGWEYMGKTGVSFTVDSVQKIREGEPFSNRKSASQLFTVIEDDETSSENVDDVGDFS